MQAQMIRELKPGSIVSAAIVAIALAILALLAIAAVSDYLDSDTRQESPVAVQQPATQARPESVAIDPAPAASGSSTTVKPEQSAEEIRFLEANLYLPNQTMPERLKTADILFLEENIFVREDGSQNAPLTTDEIRFLEENIWEFESGSN